MIEEQAIEHKAENLVAGVAFLSFIILGIPGALMGVAWSPYIQGAFNLALGDLGILLFAVTVGSLLVSFNSGRIISHLGTAQFLATGMVLVSVGMLGTALAPAWWIIVALSFVTGMGIGALDPGLSTYASANRSPRFMNWLHASFGVGAAVGPFIMTVLLSLDLSWRWGYAFVGIVSALLVVSYVVTRTNWEDRLKIANPARNTRVGAVRTLRLPILWFGLVVFFIYGGVEFSIGQWSFPLFAEARSVDPVIAGSWISIYWGSLTAGRIIWGMLTDRIGLTWVLRLGMLGLIIGTLLIWLNISGVVGLSLAGFAQAPILPLLTSNTPQRVGSTHAPNAIGFQSATLILGATGFPSLAGVLAGNISLEVIGPYVVTLSTVLFVLHEILVRRQKPA